jgi:hypothetical protein
MPLIKRLTVLYRRVFRRAEVDKELDAEVAAYFEILVERYMAQGMCREVAQRTARIKFDGPEQIKQQVRQAQMGAAIEATLKDVRYAARMLGKNPGFAAVAIFSLAIGLGATSGTYSIADALLLRPLPVPKASSVIAISPVTDQVLPGLNAISYPHYVDLRDHNRTFQGLVWGCLFFPGIRSRPGKAAKDEIWHVRFRQFLPGSRRGTNHWPGLSPRRRSIGGTRQCRSAESRFLGQRI